MFKFPNGWGEGVPFDPLMTMIPPNSLLEITPNHALRYQHKQKPPSETPPIDVTSFLQREGHNVMACKMHCMNPSIMSFLPEYFKYFPNLEHVMLHNPGDGYLESLGIHCGRRLRQVEVALCSIMDGACSPGALTAFVMASSASIEAMTIRSMDDVYVSVMEALSKAPEECFPNLVSLAIEGVTMKCGPYLASFLERFGPRLTCLNIPQCGVVTTDVFMSVIARRCPNLKSLNIWHAENKQLTSNGLHTLLKGLKQLTDVNFGITGKACDDSVVCALCASHGPILESVKLSASPVITNVSLQALATSCPNLTSLDVNKTGMTAEEGGPLLVTLLQTSSRLRNLEITYGKWRNRDIEPLIPMLSQAPHSFHLGVEGCKGITLKLLDALIAGGCRGHVRITGQLGSYFFINETVQECHDKVSRKDRSVKVGKH
eukprot:PhF_6_TR7012/c1_g1_i3/m.10426